MWPFQKRKCDDRQPSWSAVGIVHSLDSEPERWSLLGDNHLQHDSGIVIFVGGFTCRPNLDDEPDANGEIVCAAIDRWVAARMKMPPKPLSESPAHESKV